MAVVRPKVATSRRNALGDLDVRIDELVLHGFRHPDRYAIAEAVEQELTRLLRDGAPPPAWLDRAADGGGVSVHRLDAGSFEVPYGAGPRALAIHLARALHHGLAAGQPGTTRGSLR